MQKKISQDLKEIADIIEQHNRERGLCPQEALEETVDLVMKLGRQFNGDSLYISINQKEDRNKRVKQLIGQGLSYRTISRRMGISISSINRIKNQ